MEKTERKRRPKFALAELEVLADEVSLQKDILFGKFSSTVTFQRKKALWCSIAEKVNAVSEVERTGEECRKKWQYTQSDVKQKAARRKRDGAATGGGTLNVPDLSPIEEKIASLLPSASTQAELTKEGWQQQHSAKKRKHEEIVEPDELISIERQRLCVEEERLTTERERLQVEEERLEVEVEKQ
ncbi:PREDICTED: myb/SANT-like DNA-binding domain-containing protein 4 [Priapulus caudatus]|uniref:Regulatory protein zeste n=1 Tax=Priapulus caudatus TaxID=37621 RepID=A0ABM1DYN9_PRICU|nr:PREDICTED: myb/SANT-like DNA-binding domain-containing protein 4 [Priapulus caudatus]